jgi:hypothetical protein
MNKERTRKFLQQVELIGIFYNGPPSHGGDRKAFEVMTST